jgi:hypothetical protein
VPETPLAAQPLVDALLTALRGWMGYDERMALDSMSRPTFDSSPSATRAIVYAMADLVARRIALALVDDLRAPETRLRAVVTQLRSLPRATDRSSLENLRRVVGAQVQQLAAIDEQESAFSRESSDLRAADRLRDVLRAIDDGLTRILPLLDALPPTEPAPSSRFARAERDSVERAGGSGRAPRSLDSPEEVHDAPAQPDFSSDPTTRFAQTVSRALNILAADSRPERFHGAYPHSQIEALRFIDELATLAADRAENRVAR